MDERMGDEQRIDNATAATTAATTAITTAATTTITTPGRADVVFLLPKAGFVAIEHHPRRLCKRAPRFWAQSAPETEGR
jgi:hypothetical protein